MINTSQIHPDSEDSCPEFYFFDASWESFVYKNHKKETGVPGDLMKRWLRGYLLDSEEKETLDKLIRKKEKIKKFPAVSYSDFLRSLIRLIRKGIPPYRMLLFLKYCTSNHLAQFYRELQTKSKQATRFLKQVLFRERPQSANKIRAKDSLSRGHVVSIINNSLILNPSEEIRPFYYAAERSMAKELLDLKEYDLAEKIYSHLLKAGYDAPNIHCHLCRLNLLEGKKRKASHSAEQAWKLREKASSYVIPRVIWFKMLFSFLKKDKTALICWTGRMKYCVSDASKKFVMDWDIAETLVRFKKELDPDQYKLLDSLIIALSDVRFDDTILYADILWSSAPFALNCLIHKCS